MFDNKLGLEVLHQIEMAVKNLAGRFQPIQRVSDFTDSPAGVEKGAVGIEF
jgi:hypothetical protein